MSFCEARVLILSAYDDQGLVVAAMAAGAAGYLLKSIAPDELREKVGIWPPGVSRCSTPAPPATWSVPSAPAGIADSRAPARGPLPTLSPPPSE
jgi:hypothetical protein